MHSNFSLLIAVHVHENETELERVLSSVADNASLSDCTLMVVNNSTNGDIARRISGTCAAFPNVSLELNQFNWPSIRRIITAHLGDSCTEEQTGWLNKLDLGASGWNVHHARNVGMVVAQLCYPEKKYILNLDSDIVIPQDLEVRCPVQGKLTCLKIVGCPDLSRVEWMTLYLLFLLKKYGLENTVLNDQYCYRLAAALTLNDLGGIISAYSSLELDRKYLKPSDNLIFTTREEYHGACYFISTNQLGTSAYPSWYDNDWFFFKEIRKETETLEFLDQFVSHASVRKDVLNKEAICFEEDGQIMNIIYDCMYTLGYTEVDASRLATSNRKNIVRKVMELVYLLMGKSVSKQETDLLYVVLVQLENLIRYIETLPSVQMLAEIKRHKAYQRKWHMAFQQLASINIHIQDLWQTVQIS